MKKWHWIVLAIIAYLVFLIAYIPAVYVSDVLNKQANNPLRLLGVSGTLFEGQAETLTLDGTRVNNLTWSLSPLSLLILQANLDVQGGAIRDTDQIYVKGNVAIPLLNTQKMTVTDTNVLVPAKNLFSQLSLPVAITASGRFRVDIEEMTFEQHCQSLSGRGNWLNASVNVNNQAVDLGTFTAALSCESPDLVMQIAPDNGIELDAKVTITPDGKYSALGSFAIPSSFPQEIQQGAAFFGENKGNGRYDLRF